MIFWLPSPAKPVQKLGYVIHGPCICKTNSWFPEFDKSESPLRHLDRRLCPCLYRWKSGERPRPSQQSLQKRKQAPRMIIYFYFVMWVMWLTPKRGSVQNNYYVTQHLHNFSKIILLKAHRIWKIYLMSCEQMEWRRRRFGPIQAHQNYERMNFVDFHAYTTLCFTQLLTWQIS